MSHASHSSRSALQRLLHPRSIAVIGGSVAAEVIRQCKKIGFQGEIWAVNAQRETLEGLPCYRDVASLPSAPDAAFIAVPREHNVELVAALQQRGAGGVVCYASGFAEIGGDGILLQQRLCDAAADMALVGPNCYGVLNFLDRCALWPDRHGGRVVERGVAILTQSGNIGLNITMQQRQLPLAYMIAVGNCAGTAFHDYVDALLDDDRITAIGLHIEGLNDIAAFSRVALRALQKRIPIVALKTGASTASASVTASHTSSLAGSDTLYNALFARFGIGRVNDLSAFIETLKLLHVNGSLSGDSVASLSCSGGDAALFADLVAAQGLRFPSLNDRSKTLLEKTLGPKVPLNNPLDYHTYIWGDVPALTNCFRGMLMADNAITALILDYPKEDDTPIEGWDEIVSAYIAAQQQEQKPALVVSTLAELMPARVASQLHQANIAAMQGLAEAAVAIRVAAEIGAKQGAVNQVRAVQDGMTISSGDEYWLSEVEAKKQLAAYGLNVPPSHVVGDENAAYVAAEMLGYPVVVKAVSAQLTHKTEAGAVQLHVQNGTQVQNAVRATQHLSSQFLVEKMVAAPLTELIVGVLNDAQFGLSLTMGAGGIYVELLRDSVTLLLPCTRTDIVHALRQLRCFPLLNGYRGKPAADLDTVAEAVLAIVQYAHEHAGHLQELDVNPLMITADAAIAVDALIKLRR